MTGTKVIEAATLGVSEMSENLTPKQQQLLEWLALPKDERHPHTQELFARSLGISEKTLRRWKKDLGLDTLAAELAAANLIKHVPDVLGALAREARKGNIQHIKTILEMVELYTEEVNVNVNDARKQATQELDELAAKRASRMAGTG